jgi:hypothetical protein
MPDRDLAALYSHPTGNLAKAAQRNLERFPADFMPKPRDSIRAKIEEGLEHSRVLVPCMSASALRSGQGGVAAEDLSIVSHQPTADPLNKECCFISLRLDDSP